MTKRKNNAVSKIQGQAEELDCPICGARDYEWGVSTGYYKTGLEPFGAGQVQRHMLTRKCNNCGHLVQFADETYGEAAAQRSNLIVFVAVGIAVALTVLSAVIAFLMA